MNTRSSLARWLNATGLDVSPLGAFVLAALLVTLALAAFILWPVLRTRHAVSETPVVERNPVNAADAFDSALEKQVAMIEGRSLFAIPHKPDEVPTGPAPKNYTGPQLIAFVNGAAWFADGQKISDAAPKAKTLELVRADPPWSIRVKWQGGEYDVELFKRVPVSSLNDSSKSPSANMWTPINAGGTGARATDSRPAATFQVPPGIEEMRPRSLQGLAPSHNAILAQPVIIGGEGGPGRPNGPNGGNGGGSTEPSNPPASPPPANPQDPAPASPNGSGNEPAPVPPAPQPGHAEPAPAPPANPPANPPSEPSEP